MAEASSGKPSPAPSPLTRRSVLVEPLKVAVAGAFLAGLRSDGVPLAQEVLPARKFRVGFLGTGHSHFTGKLALLQNSPDFELIGACEEQPALRERKLTGVTWIDREQLFAAAEVVVVESEVRHHARDAKRALEAGKHVHVEKPPAATLAELKELLELAARNRKLLQVGYMWRYHAGINAIHAAVREGWLGEVFQVRATMNSNISPAERKLWAEFPGGAMFELACHLVDAVVRLMGAPAKITPFLQRTPLVNDGLADNTLAVLEYPRAIALISSAPLQANAGTQRVFEVSGSNGVARLQPIEPGTLLFDLAKPAGPYPAGKHEVKLSPFQRYAGEFVALAAALRNEQPLAVSLETELAVQQTVLQACGMAAAK